MRKRIFALGLAVLLVFAAGCGDSQTAAEEETPVAMQAETIDVSMEEANLEISEPEEEESEAEPEAGPGEGPEEEPEAEPGEEPEEEPEEELEEQPQEELEPEAEPEEEVIEAEIPEVVPEEPQEDTEEIIGEIRSEEVVETEPVSTEYRGLVVIDPGHQSSGDGSLEPSGPGSSDMKAKVSSGTSGVSTGKAEYELNLEVSLKLRDELVSRGYEVIMTRESNDVWLSNAERAQIANEANADVFVRIHANGDDNQSVNGVITICQTASNPYNANLYSESRLLSDLILDAVVAETGANRQYVWETDTMTGINWAQVPSTIVEMGFMTNPDEDRMMSTESYQYQIARGIANGIDQFMESR